MTQQKVLLLCDIEDLGRSGDLVSVKPGYARNYLLPQKFALYADKRTLRMQERLKEERAKKAAADRHEAEKQADVINSITLVFNVKVDEHHHMYGSVSSVDVLHGLEKEGLQGLTRRNILLAHPLKTLGVHTISLKLKEGVEATVTVKIESDEVVAQASATAQ